MLKHNIILVIILYNYNYFTFNINEIIQLFLHYLSLILKIQAIDGFLLNTHDWFISIVHHIKYTDMVIVLV